MKIMVINGPNLNMLGIREKNIYGTFTYEDLCKYIETYPNYKEKDIDFTFLQTNHEVKQLILYIKLIQKNMMVLF